MNRSHRPEQHRLIDALDDLAQPASGGAPDLSRSIMGRLGYMRIDPRVARRRMFMKWANRTGMAAVAGVALVIGWRVFEASPQVRRPAQTTVPQAISRDVAQQQQRVGSMIQTIRDISVPRFTPRFGPDMAPARSESPTASPGRSRNSAPIEAPGTFGAPSTADIQYAPEHAQPDPVPHDERDDQYQSPVREKLSAPFGRQESPMDMNRAVRSPVRMA